MGETILMVIVGIWATLIVGMVILLVTGTSAFYLCKVVSCVVGAVQGVERTKD
jgi:hypothetical protein